MSNLSERRKQAIYDAVADRITDLRVQIAREYPGNETAKRIDELLFRAESDAGHAAIEAAETGDHTRKWRTVARSLSGSTQEVK